MLRLLQNLFRVFRANANAAIYEAEDPEKILDQIISDMESERAKVRSAVLMASASEKRLYQKCQETQAEVSLWNERAQQSWKEGNIELEEEALRYKIDYQRNLDDLSAQWQQQKQDVAYLRSSLSQLEKELQSRKIERDNLKARSRSAKASEQVHRVIGAIDPNANEEAFKRMRDKVADQNARAQATREMAEEKFNSRFKDMDYRRAIDAERAARDAELFEDKPEQRNEPLP